MVVAYAAREMQLRHVSGHLVSETVHPDFCPAEYPRPSPPVCRGEHGLPWHDDW